MRPVPAAALLAGLALAAAGCGGSKGDAPAPPPAAPPPAAPAKLRLTTVARGLDAPLYVAAPRGERGAIYVVEQAGTIRRLAGKRRTLFLDLRSQVRSGGEQGLLSVAFSPRYAANRRLYVDYTDRSGDTRVVELRARGGRADPATARQLLHVKQPYPNHNGGQLAFDPGGALWVGMGDGGSGGDPENRAQSPRTLLGKLVRIDVGSGRVSAPFIGLRNPWRFSFDRATKALLVADVGQDEWEEVDVVPRSRLGKRLNFGWDAYEGRAPYEPKQLGPGALVRPALVYRHAAGRCSITGGYVYRGRAVPAARGRYFFGDFCTGEVWSARLSGTALTDVRREPFKVPQLTSFGEDARGELYLVSGAGTVYRLAR